MSTPRTSPASFIKHATDVALFYGFRPAREIERAAANRLEKRIGVHSFETVAKVSAAYTALNAQEPTLAFYATPSPTHVPKKYLLREVGEFGLQVIGSQESVGEVVLLKTLAAILTEWGAKITRVRINALGDKDSQQRFLRELSVYVRKQQGQLDEACKLLVGESPTSIYDCTHGACRAILEGAPRSMNFLSERSRVHFRAVLEHLENLGLPYELDDLLLGDSRSGHLSFVFDLEEDDATVLGASGGRYDEYLRQHIGRKEALGVGASVFFRKTGASRTNFASAHQVPGKKPGMPNVYFVQLGTRAKLQGLAVVDMLRQARIPVSQSFDTTHLSPQLLAAKTLGVSHMLIMGQREAIDGTIIVRSTTNSSQTIIQVTNLPRFLKTLR